MRIVLPTKGDMFAVHREESMIGNCHAVGIASQVLKHMFRPAKGCLGVNDPVLPKQSAQEGCKCVLISQRLTLAVEGQLLSLKGLA